MRKSLVILALVLVAAHLSAAKVYFINSPHWSNVYAYMWTNGGEMTWPGKAMSKESGFTCSKGEVYSIEAGSYTYIIFSNNGSPQTADLTIDPARPYWYEENAYASIEEIEHPTPVKSVGVPSESEDVMLQGFYWDSYKTSAKYGCTKWSQLTPQVSEWANIFTLVWLPPSSNSSGGLGYHPTKLGSFNGSALGTSGLLDDLIEALHDNGIRVVADIVINHIAGTSTWCNIGVQSFGTYGSFTPDMSWICKTDEVNTDSGAGACKGTATGAADDGYGTDANYGAARDWDHTNVKVQEMCKAYLSWLINTIHYDGFRYDYSKGYNVSHVSDYNQAAEPYLSVLEYWDGNKSTLKSRIDGAKKNTMVFDFAAKYSNFRDGIYKKNYNKLKGEGLRSIGYGKYAITFIDNHDTFARSDNEDVAGKKDGSSVNDKDLMMRCNAYLLSMPGIPCVFYPHWVTYKEEIGQMVKARRAARIHSESAVSEEAATGYYKATVTGKEGGSVILYLGSAASEGAPAGYKTAIKGSTYAMYYKEGKGTGWEAVQVETPAQGRKVLLDGQLLVEHNGSYYDMFGKKIK